MPEELKPELQHQVQRQLGRCLLRVQQYERLMKSILSAHEMGGPVEELEARQAARIKRFSGKSLGQLVEALFETFVVSESNSAAREGSAASAPANKFSVSFQFHLAMEDDRLATVKSAVEDLVQLRNDLVHHFIERFDVWTNSGCESALEHLQACYERIDRHHAELRQWAEYLDHARRDAASFAQSGALADWLVDGIQPDGIVDWSNAGIVRALRDASRECQQRGWTRLDTACAWIAQRHPEQTPTRYSCKSWPEVLSRSRVFKLEYRMDDDHKVAWFQELTR